MHVGSSFRVMVTRGDFAHRCRSSRGRSLTPIVEPALLTGVGPRVADVPTVAGHPYVSPYEDLKLKAPEFSRPRERRNAMANALVASLVALLICGLGTSTAWAQTAGHVMASPADLKWLDVPSLPAGAKIAVIEGQLSDPVPFTFRLKFPANYKIPAHSHPAIERVTVIYGTLNLGMGDVLDETKTSPLPVGSIAIMPPKTNHFGWTKEETVVQLHGVGPWAVTYVNPADDPRKK